MAVAFDAATESSTWTTTPDPFTFTHTPSGTPTGVLLAVVHNTGTTREIDATPTYGGVAMDVEQFTTATIVGTETGRSYMFWLPAPPTGAQTVSIPHTASANVKIATAVTFTGTDLVLSNAQTKSAVNTATSLSCRLLTATNAMRVVVIFSGANSPAAITPLSGMTAVTDHDFTSQSVRVDRETTPSSDFTIGYVADGEESAICAVAVEES